MIDQFDHEDYDNVNISGVNPAFVRADDDGTPMIHAFTEETVLVILAQSLASIRVQVEALTDEHRKTCDRECTFAIAAEAYVKGCRSGIHGTAKALGLDLDLLESVAVLRAIQARAMLTNTDTDGIDFSVLERLRNDRDK